MKRYHLSCGCIVETIIRPTRATCGKHQSSIVFYESRCKVCDEYFFSENKRKRRCDKCLPVKKPSICKTCGAEYDKLSRNLECKKCRSGRTKRELITEQRNIDCPSYYQCLDMAARNGELVIGCNGCMQN